MLVDIVTIDIVLVVINLIFLFSSAILISFISNSLSIKLENKTAEQKYWLILVSGISKHIVPITGLLILILNGFIIIGLYKTSVVFLIWFAVILKFKELNKESRKIYE